MNVFTGLAVGDVATVMHEAEQVKARYQMKIVANYRAHPLFKTSNRSCQLDLEIINAEDRVYDRVARDLDFFQAPVRYRSPIFFIFAGPVPDPVSGFEVPAWDPTKKSPGQPWCIGSIDRLLPIKNFIIFNFFC